MLNSILLMLSQCKQNTKRANVFKLIWIIYTVFFSFVYCSINLIAFILISLFIHYISMFGSKINKILSVCSILLYSFFIDIICYYTFPTWANGLPLLKYIINGFLFNYKYVFTNIIILTSIIMFHKLFRIKHRLSVSKQPPYSTAAYI